MLTTQNETAGFYGTTAFHLDVICQWSKEECDLGLDKQTADSVWNQTFEAIHEATNLRKADIQTFLDSSLGRHFADMIFNRVRHNKGEETSRIIKEVVAEMKARTAKRVDSKAFKCGCGASLLEAQILYIAKYC